MKKKKIILIIFVILLVIAFGILVYFGINKENEKPIKNETKEEIKPKIIEEYTTVLLNTIKEYDDILYYENNTIFYYANDGKHIIYKNGVLLNKEEIINDNNSKYIEYHTFKKYDYYIENDYEKNCIKDKTNNEIECYDEINTISNYQESTDYLILIKYNDDGNKLYLLNPNTGTLVDLTKINVTSIYSEYSSDDENGNMSFKEYDYLPACTSYEKCGLIDYNGNVLIDFVYDNVNYINKDFIIATKNEKQGIINYKNAYKLSFDYDYIDKYGNYIIAVKDFKLSVFNDDLKLIVNNINIDIAESDVLYNFYLNTDVNKNLYINVEEENINHLYLLNNKKLLRQIDSPGNIDYLYNNEIIEFIAFNYTNNNKLYIIFYDTDLYEYWTFSKEIKNNIDWTVQIENNYKNKKYYNISIYYDLKDYNKTYYVDLINSKEIDELTALGKHFSNGYTWTITNDKLNVYKEKELLNSFNGNYTHINEYTFIDNNSGKGKIINVEFKKETREVE